MVDTHLSNREASIESFVKSFELVGFENKTFLLYLTSYS